MFTLRVNLVRIFVSVHSIMLYVCSQLFESVKYKTQVHCIALTPFKHENGCISNKQTFCVTAIKASLATRRTKPGNTAQTSFRREPHLETQATERLYKDVPPSALILFLYAIRNN